MYKLFIVGIFCCMVLVSCNNGGSPKKDVIAVDTTETIESISKKIRENPENANLFLRRAELQFIDENIIEAINDAEIALRLDSLRPEIYTKLSEYYLLKGNSGSAKDVLIRCLAKFPKNADARLKLAQIYYYVELFKEAMKEIVFIEENDLQNADSYFVKALILNETQSYQEAIKALRKTIEYDSNHWEAYNLIGTIYCRLKDKLAVEYFTTATKLFPTNLEIRFNAGLTYQTFELTDRAIKEYEFVVAQDSSFSTAYYNMGYIYVNVIKNYDKAVENFSKAIASDSVFYQAFYNRGYSYEIQGKYKLAETDYRQALKIMPNYDLAVKGLNEVINKHR